MGRDSTAKFVILWLCCYVWYRKNTDTYTKGRGIVQRDEATFILGIHIRSILQEKLHHIKVIIPS